MPTERAEKEWGSLWECEHPYVSNKVRGVPLPDLTVEDFDEVLKNIPKNKAGGADH